MKFNLEIISPLGTFLKRKVDQLNLRTSEGDLGILAEHIPLVASVVLSELSYFIDDKKQYCANGNGLLVVEKDKTVVLLESIVNAEDIDLELVKNQKARIERQLETQKQKVEEIKLRQALDQATNLIRVKEQN